MSADELDALLRDRLDLSRAEFISALKTLPPRDQAHATLNADEAKLLDRVGFVAVPGAYAESVAALVADTARLIDTSYSDAEVAVGLGVSESVVRQRRRERTLWAIEVDGLWRYPTAQFILVDVEGGSALTLVPHLDRVLAVLPPDLQPTAVAGFLMTPMDALLISGRGTTVLDWLINGGAVEPVFELIEISWWAAS
jgi:hypothetical protein